MKESQYGPCGIYCGACGADDCGGCRSDRTDQYVEKCRFRTCTREKGLNFCYSCADYSCQDIHGFMNDEWPHHWTMETNLEFIKKNGLEKWLENQKKEWSCQSCAKRIYWYQKECSCGRKLESWELPESYTSEKE